MEVLRQQGYTRGSKQLLERANRTVMTQLEETGWVNPTAALQSTHYTHPCGNNGEGRLYGPARFEQLRRLCPTGPFMGPAWMSTPIQTGGKGQRGRRREASESKCRSQRNSSSHRSSGRTNSLNPWNELWSMLLVWLHTVSFVMHDLSEFALWGAYQHDECWDCKCMMPRISEEAREYDSLEHEPTMLWDMLGVLHPWVRRHPHIAVHGANTRQHVCLCPTKA